MPEYCRRLSGASCFKRVSMTAWASWQFREFVFHVTKNANTASREEGNLYRLAVPWCWHTGDAKFESISSVVQSGSAPTPPDRRAQRGRTAMHWTVSWAVTRTSQRRRGQGQAKPLTQAQSSCWCAPRAAPSQRSCPRPVPLQHGGSAAVNTESKEILLLLISVKKTSP